LIKLREELKKEIGNTSDVLKQEETLPGPYIKKGNYYIIPLPELSTQDKTFLTI
jgi:hypothetical protein